MKLFKRKSMCDYAQENMDAYLDRDLTADEVVQVETHLQECFSCREELEFAKQVRDELRDFPRQECPDTVLNAAMGRFKRQEQLGQDRMGPLTKPIFVWGLRAAIIVALCFGLLIPAFLHKRSPEPSSEISQEELARARQDVQIAIAYLGHAGRRSASIVLEEMAEARTVPHLKNAFAEIMETKSKLLNYPKSLITKEKPDATKS